VINPHLNTSFIANCLLDSGADKCIFPHFIVKKILSVKSGAKSQSKGIAGLLIDTYPHDLILELLSQDYKNVIWKSETLKIDCVYRDDIPPLLGSSNFLKNFNIAFNYRDSSFVIDV